MRKFWDSKIFLVRNVFFPQETFDPSNPKISCKHSLVRNGLKGKKQDKTRRCNELRCMYDFPIKLVLGTTPSAARDWGRHTAPLFPNERNKTSDLDKMQLVHDNTEPVQPVHYV